MLCSLTEFTNILVRILCWGCVFNNLIHLNILFCQRRSNGLPAIETIIFGSVHDDVGVECGVLPITNPTLKYVGSNLGKYTGYKGAMISSCHPSLALHSLMKHNIYKTNLKKSRFDSRYLA